MSDHILGPSSEFTDEERCICPELDQDLLEWNENCQTVRQALVKGNFSKSKFSRAAKAVKSEC